MNEIEKISKCSMRPYRNITVDILKSKDSWLVDTSGKKYLDFFSQYASQPLGWNNDKLSSYQEEISKYVLNKISNCDIASSPYAEFVEEFSSITPDFTHHFFIDGGTLGVENAIKAAFDWKFQRLGWSDDKLSSQLSILHLKGAFHGRSGYSLSLTNTDENKIKYFPKFKWPRITNPKIKFPLEINYVRNLETMSLIEADNALKKGFVAAILIEPIQGEGGDNHFRNEYITELRSLANKYDCLLIFDEVQTGMGLTGKMWCYEHFDVKPDLICFGKKVQVCGCSSTKKIDSVKNHVFNTPSRISSTWGGNLIDMLRSTYIIKIIKEDNLVENARIIGEYLLSNLKNISGISNVRGKGLMLAFDLSSESERDKVYDKINENMLVIKCGKKSIRLRPHLNLNKSDADSALNFIENSLH